MAASSRVSSWLANFDSALKSGDLSAATELFCAEECLWRDLVAFTWNIYTAESRHEIRAMLQATLPHTCPSAWAVDGDVQELEAGAVLQAFFTFETQAARCRGIVKLRDGKCWCLLTSMLELKGHEEKSGLRRELGSQHVAAKGRRTWLDGRIEELQSLGRTSQPFVVIVGGGQGGIALGARLRRLGVPTIIVEKNKRPGDSWRNRYKSLCVHDPVWFDHLPYLPFPSHWPVFSPKDKLGDWLEAYTQLMELVYWTSTECKSARFDSRKGVWEVLVEKEGESITLYPNELVLATGMSGFANIPTFPGADTFQGVQCHSSQYDKWGQHFAGKRCLVVGSNNSAHDICTELWENGAAQVTMVQRSPTLVVRSQTLSSFGLGPFCENSKYSTEDADLLFASTPHKIFHRDHIVATKMLQIVDSDFYAGLRDAGFLLNFGEDKSGLIPMYLRRGSGYYIDVGASELVISGDIKLKSGVGVKEVKPSGVVFSDGTEAPADLIIYATGYGSMNQWAAKLISQEVAHKVGKCWGLGSDTAKDPGPWEGELRNMWKPTQQPHLWFHGGNLQQSRHFSLSLALQLKARMEGISTPVYGLPKVHHTQ